MNADYQTYTATDRTTGRMVARAILANGALGILYKDGRREIIRRVSTDWPPRLIARTIGGRDAARLIEVTAD